MISPEVFEYFKRRNIKSPMLITYEDILPIRSEMSVEAMSGWQLEEDDAHAFWERIDTLDQSDIIDSIYFEISDLFTENTEDDEELSDEELFDMSQDAYIAAIYLVTTADDEAVIRSIEGIQERFGCEIFKAENPQDLELEISPQDNVWCIVWD